VFPGASLAQAHYCPSYPLDEHAGQKSTGRYG
jgi:hypothetical protein